MVAWVARTGERTRMRRRRRVVLFPGRRYYSPGAWLGRTSGRRKFIRLSFISFNSSSLCVLFGFLVVAFSLRLLFSVLFFSFLPGRLLAHRFTCV